jgi:hypothetical protein
VGEGNGSANSNIALVKKCCPKNTNYRFGVKHIARSFDMKIALKFHS